MKRISICLLTAICLTGCMSGRLTGPWVTSDTPGPWCAANKRATVQSRRYKPGWLEVANPSRTYLRYGWRRRIWVVDLQREFSRDYFTRTDFWQAWPAGRVTYSIPDPNQPSGRRDIPGRDSPFRFYLVSIFPIVLIGVPDSGDLFSEPEKGYLDPLALNFYGLRFSERVWIRTQFPTSHDAQLVYFAPKLSMELETLDLVSGSDAIDLEDGSQLVVSREDTTVVIVRKSRSPSGSGGVISSPLPHHRTCGSASGGSDGLP